MRFDRGGRDVGPECRVIDEQRFLLDRRVGKPVVCGDLMRRHAELCYWCQEWFGARHAVDGAETDTFEVHPL